MKPKTEELMEKQVKTGYPNLSHGCERDLNAFVKPLSVLLQG